MLVEIKSWFGGSVLFSMDESLREQIPQAEDEDTIL